MPILELLIGYGVQPSTLIVGWLIHEQPGCLRRRTWLHLIVNWMFPLHVILIEVVCVEISLLLGSDPPNKVGCGITWPCLVSLILDVNRRGLHPYCPCEWHLHCLIVLILRSVIFIPWRRYLVEQVLIVIVNGVHEGLWLEEFDAKVSSMEGALLVGSSKLTHIHA